MITNEFTCRSEGASFDTSQVKAMFHTALTIRFGELGCKLCRKLLGEQITVPQQRIDQSESFPLNEVGPIGFAEANVHESLNKRMKKEQTNLCDNTRLKTDLLDWLPRHGCLQNVDDLE
jgi:hypothetical protein